MGKESKKNIVIAILTNIYVRNIFLMAIILFALIGATLWWLNSYTRHNESVTVPELKGMQVQDIETLINSSHLKYEIVDSIYHEGGTPGAILEQIPVGNSKVKEGRTIYLTVQSINEPMVAIPDLEDASLRQAQTLLSTLGFTHVAIEYIPSEFRDLVYGIEHKGQKLKAGQKIPKNATITIKVGNGGDAPGSSDSLNYNEDNIEETF